MSFHQAITRQYKAGLTMLRAAIEACPEELWLAGEPNRYWHIAYHALFYTHFYLGVNDAAFVARPMHQAESNYLGEIPFKPGYRPPTPEPYAKADLLDYADFCTAEVERQLGRMTLNDPSGFYWLPFTKLELQLYNIRHLAHHTGQLVERLRTQADIGVPWQALA
jgi:hypothetical protein